MDLKKIADDLVFDYLQHFGSDVVNFVKEKTGRNPLSLPNSALYQIAFMSLTGSPFPLDAFQKPADPPVPVVQAEGGEPSKEGLQPPPSTMFPGIEASHCAFLTAHGGTTRSTTGLDPSGKDLASRKMPPLDRNFVTSGNVSGATVSIIAGQLKPTVAANTGRTLLSLPDGAVRVKAANQSRARLPPTTLTKCRSPPPVKVASQPVCMSPGQRFSAGIQAELPSKCEEDVGFRMLNGSSTKPPMGSPVSSASVRPPAGTAGPSRSTAVTRAARRLPFDTSSSEDSDEYENPEVSIRPVTSPATSTVRKRAFRRIKVASSSGSSPEVDAKTAKKEDSQVEGPWGSERLSENPTASATLAFPCPRSATILLVKNVLFPKIEAESADDETSDEENKKKPVVAAKFPAAAEMPAFAKTIVGSARKRAHRFADRSPNGKPKIRVTPSPAKPTTAQHYFSILTSESEYSRLPYAPVPTPSRIVRPRMPAARIQTVKKQMRDGSVVALHADKSPLKVAPSKLQSKSSDEEPEPSKNFAMAGRPEFNATKREEESSDEDEQLSQKKALMKPDPPSKTTPPKPTSVREEDEILEALFNISIEAAWEARYAVGSGMDLSPISLEEAPWFQQFKRVQLDCMRRYREAKESQLEVIKVMTAHFRVRKILHGKLEEARIQSLAAEKAMEMRETSVACGNHNLAQIQLVETADRLKELTDTLHVLEERKELLAKTQFKALAQLCRVLSKCTELLKPQHATLPLMQSLSRLFELESL